MNSRRNARLLRLASLFGRIFCGKPVSTFPENAPRHVHAEIGGACDGPARTAPGEMTMVKRENTRGRDACRGCGTATLAASGGASVGAADVQYSQQRCRTLPASGAAGSAASPDPWQMAPSGSAAGIVPACAVATPARKACSTTSHTAIRAVGRRQGWASNPVGTDTSRMAR